MYVREHSFVEYIHEVGLCGCSLIGSCSAYDDIQLTELASNSSYKIFICFSLRFVIIHWFFRFNGLDFTILSAHCRDDFPFWKIISDRNHAIKFGTNQTFINSKSIIFGNVDCNLCDTNPRLGFGFSCIPSILIHACNPMTDSPQFCCPYSSGFPSHLLYSDQSMLDPMFTS
jgi:hypothetical protein